MKNSKKIVHFINFSYDCYILDANPDCTTVQNVTVIEGSYATLLCKIKNRPEHITFFQKSWSKKFTSIYIIFRNKMTRNRDEAAERYRGRVSKLNDNKIQLMNVTKSDAGRYECRWQLEPHIPGCEGATAAFYLTVISKQEYRYIII